MQKAADLCRRHGGAMHIRRIIISVIVTLGAVGSIMVGSAAPTTLAQASTVHVVAAAPNTLFHG
jgi:hypothetical protein